MQFLARVPVRGRRRRRGGCGRNVFSGLRSNRDWCALLFHRFRLALGTWSVGGFRRRSRRVTRAAHRRDHRSDRGALAFLEFDLIENAFRKRLQHHVGLVGFDLRDWFAMVDGVPGMLKPPDNFAFFHRIGELGHYNFVAHGWLFPTAWPVAAARYIISSAALTMSPELGRTACSSLAL